MGNLIFPGGIVGIDIVRCILANGRFRHQVIPLAQRLGNSIIISVHKVRGHRVVRHTGSGDQVAGAISAAGQQIPVFQDIIGSIRTYSIFLHAVASGICVGNAGALSAGIGSNEIYLSDQISGIARNHFAGTIIIIEVGKFSGICSREINRLL